MKAYEVRLEEIRAGLNVDFAEAMAIQGRIASQRFHPTKLDVVVTLPGYCELLLATSLADVGRNKCGAVREI